MSERSIVRVRDVMTPDVIIIDRMSTVREAVATMRKHGVSSVCVERRDKDDEYGLLVVTDIAREVIGKNLSPDRVNVYEVMSKPVLTVSPDMDVVYAVRLLTHFMISRAMVIDEHRRPVGLVTLRDMALRHIDDE